MIQQTILGHATVLDHGYVRLLQMMPDPRTVFFGASDEWIEAHARDQLGLDNTFGLSDLSVATAARTSNLASSKGAEKDSRLIDYLMRNRHSSPFEQVEYQFEVCAPLVVWWQWYRHRTAQYMSMNSQSGRYVEFDNEPYIPVHWRAQSIDNKQGSSGYIEPELEPDINDAVHSHFFRSFELYQDMLAAGIAKEMARFVLPHFVFTTPA
jgi:thymidylate synthase (FAD)